MGRAGAARVAERFTWTTRTDQLRTLLAAVTGRE
jgi:hypothetical protein